MYTSLKESNIKFAFSVIFPSYLQQLLFSTFLLRSLCSSLKIQLASKLQIGSFSLSNKGDGQSLNLQQKAEIFSIFSFLNSKKAPAAYLFCD